MHRPLTSRALAASGPSHRPRARRLPASGAVALAVALLAGACGGGTGSATPAATDAEPTTTTAAPSTTTTELRVTGKPLSEELRSRYITYLEAYRHANDPPDPTLDALAEVADGAALARARTVAEENLAKGLSFRQPANSVQRVEVIDAIAVAPGQATARICLVDDGLIVATSNGAVLNDRVATKVWSVHFVEVDGRWKVSELVLDASMDGVAPCG